MKNIKKRHFLIIGAVSMVAFKNTNELTNYAVSSSIGFKGYVKNIIEKNRIKIESISIVEPFVGDVYLVNGFLVEKQYLNI